MPQDTAPFNIEFVKAAPADATRYIGTLAFTVDIDDKEHATVVRSWQNDKGEWKNQYNAEIDGPCRIRVKQAWLKENTKREPYIQVEGLMLPRALADAIAAEAIRLLGEKLGTPAPAATGTGKRGGR